MKTLSSTSKPCGFSLIELLMALAVISMLAAMVIFNLSDVTTAGKQAASLRNAQELCEIHAAARAAGVQFRAVTDDGILDELIEGRKGQGVFATSEFRLPLGQKEKQAVLKQCAYDARTGILSLR